MDEEETGGDVSLGLATLEQIVEELGRRYICVVVGVDGIPGDVDVGFCTCYTHGSPVHAIGLTTWIKEFILEEGREARSESDECDEDGEG